MRVTLFIKETKPGAGEVISYLKDHFADVSIFSAEKYSEFPQEAYKCKQDILISYLAPWVIPAKMLDTTRLWNINFHPGPPEYPGIGCTNFAIYNNEKSYGVTSHLMEKKVDTGMILAVKRFDMSKDESVYSLSMKSYKHMLELFYETMDRILNRNELPETDEKWTRSPYKREELEMLCRIEPGTPKIEIERRVKATKYPGMPGAYKRVFIIAEAGVNHNGDMDIARKLIDVAADAGADAVKFQTFKAERLVSRNAPKAEYQKASMGERGSQFDMLSALELNVDSHRALIEHCNKRGVKFLSTPFDLESVDMLNQLGLDTIKIPSGEITNLSYLRKIGALKKRVIMSTGMAEFKEVQRALNVLVTSGTKKSDITILHCNTEYPSPVEDVNLLAMCGMKKTLNVETGYSDHTTGIEVSIAAVALGATVIEKHFTLDRNMEGPDHKASLEPDELKSMVRAIRNIERALGDKTKRPSASELKNRSIARKSIVASRNIKKGEVFTEENITLKRPGTGICPMNWDITIGKKSKTDFKKDELIVL